MTPLSAYNSKLRARSTKKAVLLLLFHLFDPVKSEIRPSSLVVLLAISVIPRYLYTMSLKNRITPLPTLLDHSRADPLPTAAFPASEAFELIASALKADPAERKNAMKQANSIFAFTLKNKAGETESWNIDLKTKGEVSKGLGDKPTGKHANSF